MKMIIEVEMKMKVEISIEFFMNKTMKMIIKTYM